MTEEKFLARWSRRKRAAALQAEPRPAAPAAGEAAPESSPALPAPQEPQPPAPSESLPPSDAIDGGTDSRGFLAKGVRTAPSFATLRRAWASDPGIRDFVGLSENAWDFTASDGVPGFGAVSAEDVGRLLSHAEESPAASPEIRPDPPIAVDAAPSRDATAPAADQPREAPASGAAASLEASGTERAASPPARRHGGALPR